MSFGVRAGLARLSDAYQAGVDRKKEAALSAGELAEDDLLELRNELATLVEEYTLE